MSLFDTAHTASTLSISDNVRKYQCFGFDTAGTAAGTRSNSRGHCQYIIGNNLGLCTAEQYLYNEQLG